MSKTVIAVIVAGVVIIGGYFAFSSGKGGDSAVGQPSGKKMAFSEFIKQGGAYQCTINQSMGGTNIKSTTYVNNGMMRGDYSTKVGGIDVVTTVLVRDGYNYTWSSMSPMMGFKEKIVSGGSVDSGTSAGGATSFNADEIGDYDCNNWIPEQSKFALPSGVKFQDASAY